MSETEDSAALKNRVSESKQNRRENIESKTKLWEIYSEEKSNEWKVNESFFFFLFKLYL